MRSSVPARGCRGAAGAAPGRWDSLSAHDNHSPNPGEAGANPALSRNREPGPPQGPSKSEHLADWGSDTVRGRRWSPDRALVPAGPTLTLGLTEGHLVNTTTHGRAAALLVTLLTAALATVALAAPAQAAAYRYWSYWQGATGTWVAAQTGPGDYTLVDAGRPGLALRDHRRHADPGPPDNAPVFADLCPDLAAAGATCRPGARGGRDRRRVTPPTPRTGQTPPADVVSCVTVPEGSTGNQALAAAGAVTEDSGLDLLHQRLPRGRVRQRGLRRRRRRRRRRPPTDEQPNPAVVAAGTTDRATRATSRLGQHLVGWVRHRGAASWPC